MKDVQFNSIRALISFQRDYTINEGLFLIEQYILYRTGKKIVCSGGDIELFNQAVTTAEVYFKMTYKKLWH